MSNRFDLIAFDADDTLWHNETLYAQTQQRFTELLAPYQNRDDVMARLYQTEMRNLHSFGYGIKGFTLSMIETAIQLTAGQISGREIQSIIDFAHDMLAADVRLLEGVQDTIAALAPRYPLMIITKGDLFDQETKLARSGLGEYFRRFEILPDKTRERYAALLARQTVDPARFLMIGNSLRSDILPVIELGGQAVYIPYELTWAHEVVDTGLHRYHQIANITALPALLAQLEEEFPSSAPVSQ